MTDYIKSPTGAPYKIAFTGTNSSGKTTMALAVTARLKEQYHHLAEVVSSQDRKITWADKHFPANPLAHYGMITNMIHAEVAATLKGDATTVVTDRSVLDLYSIAVTDHPNDPLIIALAPMVREYAKTYTRIYYLPPLPYQEDGKRPSDDFRMKTHESLRALIIGWGLPNLTDGMPRAKVFKDILPRIGIETSKIGNGTFLPNEKWQELANHLGATVVAKVPAYLNTSDQDVWVCGTNVNADMIDKAVKWANLMFGPNEFHIMAHPATKAASLDPEVYKVFYNTY